jgi:hypothetical protein
MESEPIQALEKSTKIRTCPVCGQKTEIKEGDAWKILFRKPTFNEWVTLVLIIMVIAAAFLYQRDIRVCKETLDNLDMICAQRAGIAVSQYSNLPFNLTNKSCENISNSSCPS